MALSINDLVVLVPLASDHHAITRFGSGDRREYCLGAINHYCEITGAAAGDFDPKFVQFILKNHYQYKDKLEVDHGEGFARSGMFVVFSGSPVPVLPDEPIDAEVLRDQIEDKSKA